MIEKDEERHSQVTRIMTHRLCVIVYDLDSSNDEDFSSGFVDKRPRNDYLEVVKKHSKPLGVEYYLASIIRTIKQAQILIHDKPDKTYNIYTLGRL